jgi:hypothetical protein
LNFKGISDCYLNRCWYKGRDWFALSENKFQWHAFWTKWRTVPFQKKPEFQRSRKKYLHKLWKFQEHNYHEVSNKIWYILHFLQLSICTYHNNCYTKVITIITMIKIIIIIIASVKLTFARNNLVNIHYDN